MEISILQFIFILILTIWVSFESRMENNKMAGWEINGFKWFFIGFGIILALWVFSLIKITPWHVSALVLMLSLFCFWVGFEVSGDIREN